MSALVEIRGVSKAFGGVQAVTKVSLDVQKGEIFSVIGPNGAGKTTVLNMISGFYHPDAGRIVVEGTDISSFAASRVAALGFARTFQNIALFKGMTVLDNLMLGRHVRMKSGVLASFVYWGLAQKEEVAHRRRVEDIIDFLKIQDLRRQPTGSLAYGLQKRVELGRALALDPRVLLLDEPMGGCNHEEKEDMARFILDVNEEWGTTIVLIEHDMGVVMDISERISVIGDNRPRLYWAQVAAQALGGVSVPVYQDSIAKELAFVWTHAECAVIVSEVQAQVDKVLALRDELSGLRLVVYDDPRGMLHYRYDWLKSFEEVQELGRKFGAEHPGRFEAEVERGRPDDVAFICYTSGTTGNPKGAMLTHGNAVVTARIAAGAEEFRVDDDYLAYLPMAWVG